jgi:hypothetical protein
MEYREKIYLNQFRICDRHMGRQELIDELQRLAAELDKSPTTNDMTEQGEYAAQAYYHYFDSWDDTLEAAGLDTTGITRAALIEDLHAVNDRIDEPHPSAAAIREHGTYSPGPFYNEFGGLDEALDAANIEKVEPSTISKAEISEEITRLARRGKPPSTSRMDSEGQFSARICADRFGSWNTAVRAAGYEPLSEAEKITQEDLLNEIKRLQNELGRPPSTKDMVESGKYTASVYFFRFESWNTAVREAGFSPNEQIMDPENQQIPASELLEELHRVADVVGDRPTIEDMSERGDYSTKPYMNRFGSWNKAIEHAGFMPFTGTSEDIFSREELIDEIQRLAQELDRPPTTQQMNEQGKFSPSPFQSFFGSWVETLRAAGLEPTEPQLRRTDSGRSRTD